MLNFVTLSLIKLRDAIVSPQQQKEQMQTLMGKSKPLAELPGTEYSKLQPRTHGSSNLTKHQKRRGGLVPKWDCGSHLVIYIFSLVTSDCQRSRECQKGVSAPSSAQRWHYMLRLRSLVPFHLRRAWSKIPLNFILWLQLAFSQVLAKEGRRRAILSLSPSAFWGKSLTSADFWSL